MAQHTGLKIQTIDAARQICMFWATPMKRDILRPVILSK